MSDYVAANHLLYEINKSQKFNTFECKLAGGIVFEFIRFDNQTHFIDEAQYSSRYIIQCNIKNNIGVTIYSFKMNEPDTLRFIDCVGNFLYYFQDTGSSIYIGLPIDNSTNGHYPSFRLLNTTRFISEEEMENINSIYFNVDTNECRYFDLTVYDAKDHYIENQIINIPLCCSELEDLMFKICLTAQIDFGQYLDQNFEDSDVLY
jgi:hypothetical protein